MRDCRPRFLLHRLRPPRHFSSLCSIFRSSVYCRASTGDGNCSASKPRHRPNARSRAEVAAGSTLSGATARSASAHFVGPVECLVFLAATARRGDFPPTVRPRDERDRAVPAVAGCRSWIGAGPEAVRLGRQGCLSSGGMRKGGSIEGWSHVQKGDARVVVVRGPGTECLSLVVVLA